MNYSGGSTGRPEWPKYGDGKGMGSLDEAIGRAHERAAMGLKVKRARLLADYYRELASALEGWLNGG